MDFSNLGQLLQMIQDPNMVQQLSQQLAGVADPTSFLQKLQASPQNGFDFRSLYGGNLTGQQQSPQEITPMMAALGQRQINLANTGEIPRELSSPVQQPDLGSLLNGPLPQTAVDRATGAVQSVPPGIKDALGRPIGQDMSTTPEQVQKTGMGYSNVTGGYNQGETTKPGLSLAEKLKQAGDVGATMTPPSSAQQQPITQSKSPLGSAPTLGSAAQAKAPGYMTGPSDAARMAYLRKSLGDLLR